MGVGPCQGTLNAAFSERRDAYEMHVKRHPGYYDDGTRKLLTRELVVDYYAQKRNLVDIKDLRAEYHEIASHVLQDVILRVKRTCDRFFDRVRSGQKPGHPRFKGRDQYDSFTYPDHAGWKFTDECSCYYPCKRKERIGSDGAHVGNGVEASSLNGEVRHAVTDKKKHKATLPLSKIGPVKVIMHREMQGMLKTLTIKREGEQWYCIFTCEVENGAAASLL